MNLAHPKYPHVFEPIKIGNVVFKNRIWSAPAGVANEEMFVTRPPMLQMLGEKTTVITNARCTGITAEGVTYVDADGSEHTVPCDNVILATGMRSRQDLAESFRGISPFFTVIGDAYKPANVRNATRTAHDAAIRL